MFSWRKLTAINPRSPFEMARIQKNNPKHHYFLKRYYEFEKILDAFKKFVDDGIPENMDFAEVDFMRKLAEIRLEWLNKINDSMKKNPAWKDSPNSTKINDLNINTIPPEQI